jgi:hypothetical protein
VRRLRSGSVIRRLIATASAVAITAAVGVITAGAASASTLDFHWYNDYYDTAVWSNGPNNPVSLVSTSTPSLTNWTPVNADDVDGIEFVEYQQAGTNRCLQFSNSAGGVVILAGCVQDRASQLWSYSGNVSDGYADAGLLESLYATQDCATAAYLSGYAVYGMILTPCSTILETQIWYTNL